MALSKTRIKKVLVPRKLNFANWVTKIRSIMKVRGRFEPLGIALSLKGNIEIRTTKEIFGKWVSTFSARGFCERLLNAVEKYSSLDGLCSELKNN